MANFLAIAAVNIVFYTKKFLWYISSIALIVFKYNQIKSNAFGGC